MAERHGIDLPTGLGFVTSETWWDQPRRTTVRIEVDEGEIGWSSSAASVTATLRQSTVEARRYSCYEWDDDPLAEIRPIRVVAVVGSPLRALAP